MKHYIDMTGKQVQVSVASGPKNDQNGNQRSEKLTGRPMWTTEAVVLDESGATVINITTAGQKPDVMVGQLVIPVQLEAIPWNTNGKHGVAYRAVELKPVTGAASTASK